MESIRKNHEFRAVYEEGMSYADKNLAVYIKKNGTEKNRIGISVSKKVGNSVVRHHLTRLVRESYRLHEQDFSSGYDIVVVGRVRAKDAGYHEIETSLMSLLKKHGIRKGDELSKMSRNTV